MATFCILGSYGINVGSLVIKIWGQILHAKTYYKIHA